MSTPILISLSHLCKESSHVRSPLRHFVEGLFLKWDVVSPKPKLQAYVPPLVGCPLLLIYYIYSYPHIWMSSSPSATWRRGIPWWQGTVLFSTWGLCRQNTHLIYVSVSGNTQIISLEILLNGWLIRNENKQMSFHDYTVELDCQTLLFSSWVPASPRLPICSAQMFQLSD